MKTLCFLLIILLSTFILVLKSHHLVQASVRKHLFQWTNQFYLKEFSTPQGPDGNPLTPFSRCAKINGIFSQLGVVLAN